MKKLITLLMVLTLLVGGAAIATAADNTVTVYVDGVKVQFPDQKAIINADSRTLVPVRFISEALGADVEWNAAARQVNVKHKGQDITLTIGQKTALVNTGKVMLDTTASISGSRTMVPLRFVSECLKAQVEWNGSQRAVYITTNEKEVTPFVGKPLLEGILTNTNGRNIDAALRTPGKPASQYMFVTPEQLPVKFGEDIIYSIDPDEDYITVKQSTSTISAVQMLIIQDGLVVGGRTDRIYEANPFMAEYSTQDATVVALGGPKVDLSKVDAFVFRGIENGSTLYLIVQNPLNRGAWRP